MNTKYYTDEEIQSMGFRYIGEHVKVARTCIIHDPSEISIGNYSQVQDMCILTGEIIIKEFCDIGSKVHLSGHNTVVMNDFSAIAENSAIFTESADYSGRSLFGAPIPKSYREDVEGTVILEKFTIVGWGCFVMPNAYLAEGSIIGAMSLAKDKYEPWKIYAGVPAKYLKDRERNIIAEAKRLRNEIHTLTNN